MKKGKKLLNRPKFDGIGEIISSLSLIITLLLSNFDNVTIIKPLYFKFIAWVISFIFLFYGLYTFAKSVINTYSLDQLLNEIVNLDSKMEHAFNIIVIRNKDRDGRYLVFKNNRWKCWLFPNCKCLNKNFDQADELANIVEKMKWNLNIEDEITGEYLGNIPSSKYSYNDKTIKRYRFYFFRVQGAKVKDDDKLSFRCNGRKYRWMTMDQMYSCRKIKKKNQDVLDYIRFKCDIS